MYNCVMSEHLRDQYEIIDITTGLIRTPSDKDVCDEANQRNDGECYEDCAGRLAVFSARLVDSDEDDGRTLIHVCPRQSTVGTGYSGTLGAVVMHSDTIPSVDDVASVADDVLSGW